MRWEQRQQQQQRTNEPGKAKQQNEKEQKQKKKKKKKNEHERIDERRLSHRANQWRWMQCDEPDNRQSTIVRDVEKENTKIRDWFLGDWSARERADKE